MGCIILCIRNMLRKIQSKVKACKTSERYNFPIGISVYLFLTANGCTILFLISKQYKNDGCEGTPFPAALSERSSGKAL